MSKIKKKKEKMKNEVLKVTDTSRMLGISPITLKSMIKTQKIPYFITPGGHYRFLRKDIEDYIKNTKKIPPCHEQKI